MRPALLALAAPLLALGQMFPFPGPGAPPAAVSIPVTFVNGKSVVGTNVALGAANPSCNATDAFCASLPLGTLTGNSIHLMIAYSATATWTVTTDQGQTLSAGPVTSTAENTRLIANFYLCGATANTRALTLAGSAAVSVVHGYLSQWAGIAGSSCLDTSAANSGTTTTGTLTAASITPSAGDLVIMDACPAAGATSFTAGSGQSGITWTKLFSHLLDSCIEQWGVWSGSGSFTPQLTTAPNTIGWVATVSAYKASTTQGTLPTGMYVAKAMEIGNPNGGEAAGNRNFEIPSVGNALLMQLGCGSHYINSITDATNAWQVLGAGGSATSMTTTALAANAAANPTGAITVNFGGSTGDCDGYVYDIVGAATSPLGNRMQNLQNQGSAGALTILSNFDPGRGAGMIFMADSHAANTTTGISSPSGSLPQCSTYAGQNLDGPSLPCQNNLAGTVSFSSETAVNITETFRSGSEAAGSTMGEAVALASPGASSGIFLRAAVTGTTVASNHITGTLGAGVSGDLGALAVTWNSSSATMSCSDSTNGSWTNADNAAANTNSPWNTTNQQVQIFYKANLAAGTALITCQASGSISSGKAIFIAHRVAGVSTLDKAPGGKASASSASPGSCNATGTITTTAEYLFSFLIDSNAVNNAQSPYTLQQLYNAGSYGEGSADLVIAASLTGSYTPQFGFSSTEPYTCDTVTFK